MRLYFARHGETDWNAARRIQGSRDIPLNARGLAQAALLAGRLAEVCPDLTHIYTSPLMRAAETARIAADRLGCPCTVLDGLREIDFGGWEGMSWAEVDASDPEAYARFCANRRTARPPHGESCQDALNRLLPALRDALAVQTGDLLFLTHSAVLKALLCYLEGTPFSSISAAYTLENAALLPMERKKVLDRL